VADRLDSGDLEAIEQEARSGHAYGHHTLSLVAEVRDLRAENERLFTALAAYREADRG
jgi:hypothetical protein